MIFGRKPQPTNMRTFRITQGEIPIDRSKIELLQFAVDEGYSDQDIVTIGRAVRKELENAEKALGQVI
jgi:hypothetical protein